MTPQNRVNDIYFLTLLLVIYLFNSPAKSYTLFQKYCQIINRNILELKVINANHRVFYENKA